MKNLLIIPFLLFCTLANADTWRFTSAKTGDDLVTKNPERTVEWCNEYYKTDDCVKAVVKEPTKAEFEAQEAEMNAQAKERQDALEELIAERITAKKAKK